MIDEFIPMEKSEKMASQLTKRELFAAMMMQGLLANAKEFEMWTERKKDRESIVQTMAQTCVKMAEALLEELKK